MKNVLLNTISDYNFELLMNREVYLVAVHP